MIPGRFPLTGDDLRLIAGWQPAIGRDRTKGCGRATLTRLRHGTVDPATLDGASTWLSYSDSDLLETVRHPRRPLRRSR